MKQNKQFILGGLCGLSLLLMGAAEYDLIKGIDMTGSTSVTATKLNQLVDNGTAAGGKGMLIYASSTPDIANNPRYSRFIWLNTNYDPPIPFAYKTNGAYWTNITAISSIAAGSVVEASIAANAVTTTKIADNAVTDAKITAGAITSTKYAAGSISNASIANLTIIGGNIATNTITVTNLSQNGGIAYQTMRINSAASSLEWQNGGTLQLTNVTIATVVTCSTVTPLDNTIPLVTDGVEVLTMSFTPKSANSKLAVNFVLSAASSVPLTGVAAVHINGAAASYAQACHATTNTTQFVGSYIVSSGSTSARTIAVRVGPNIAGSIYINGDYTGASLFGGVSLSTLTVQEIY